MLECRALKVDRGIISEDVIDTLAELFSMRGVPSEIRSDNGPEFVATVIRDWLTKVGVGTLYIEPGSPWQNGYAESFHSRLRDEFLAREEFENVAEARRLTSAWKEDYNHHRPHGTLGYLTPAEFAARSAASAPERAPATPPAAPALQRHCGLTQPDLSLPQVHFWGQVNLRVEIVARLLRLPEGRQSMGGTSLGIYPTGEDGSEISPSTRSGNDNRRPLSVAPSFSFATNHS